MRKVEVGGILWTEAQLLVQQHHDYLQPDTNWQSMGYTRVCYVDGAWREQDAFTGQGWHCRARDSDDFMMGACHLYLSDEEHEDPAVLRSSICNGLFSTGEDGVVTVIMDIFCYIHGGVFPQ